MTSPRVIYEGSTEDVTGTVNAEEILTDAMDIEFSLDAGATWHDAAWVGAEGKARKATLTVTPANAPAFPSEAYLLARIDGETIKAASNRRLLFRPIPVP